MTRVRLLARPARGVETIGQTLRAGRAAALGLLAPAPADDAGWRAAFAQASGGPARLGPQAVEALAQRQTALGAGPAAVANARRLGATGVAAIVTGQQPGLLGGPLLTLHKAAGAVSLARSLGRRLGAPVVPVFWLASEDHDLEEANQLTVLDREGQPRQLALPLKNERRSLADVEVPESASAALLAELAALLPQTPRAQEALRLVARRPGEPFVDWSARLLLDVLGDTGLVVLEARTLAPWLGAPLAALVRRGPAITSAVRSTAVALRAAGCPAPLDPRAEDLPLFLRTEAGGPRARLGLAADGRVTRDGRAWGGALEDLARHVAEHPLLASPDAVGRVLVQNAILPVLAYLAGPTELAYQAQVSAAQRAHGERFPLALPRPSAVWVDERAEAAAQAFGRTLEEALEGAVPARPTGASPTRAFLDEVAALLAQQRDQFLQQSARGLATGGAGGDAALGQALERLQATWERSRPAIEAAMDADAGVSSGRWTRLMNLLLPRARPQERTLSLLTPLARYGLDAVREGLAALDPLVDGQWLLVADAPSATA